MEERSLFQQVAACERQIVDSINLAEAWPLVERFAGLCRHSSDPDEFVAAEYILSRLVALGIPHHRYDANLFLSLPREAFVEIAGNRLPAKTASHSASTAPGMVTGPIVSFALPNPEGILDVTPELKAQVGGKIVVAEWPSAGEATTAQLMEAGASGAVFIHPKEPVHEDICTTIWGSPERLSMDRRPTIPVLNVSRPVGEKVLAHIASGPSGASLYTRLDVGWKKTLLVVAEIGGCVWPQEFVLLHGHLDSWHVGIGDNATGDGAMLEVARTLWQHRRDLKRSVRIAWWTGHSTGRYAGSTWYADAFALDLVERCIAHLNCDSPGCRWATDLTRVPAMTELVEFTKQAIKDMTGQAANPRRMHRAGDCSFNNLGISATMMLSSAIPEEVRKAKGMYGVGGCGGNNEWHTEGDTLEIADKDLLLRDTRLYALMVWRLANLAFHPLDYGCTASEIAALAREYQTCSVGALDLSPVVDEACSLAEKAARFYKSVAKAQAKTDAGTLAADMLDAGTLDAGTLAALNAAQRQIGRELVEIDYTREGRFHQDPAAPTPPLPDLSWAKDLKRFEPGSPEYGFTLLSLRRGLNRVMYRIRKAQALLDQAASLV